jgi:putative ABC transport system permease protein
MEEALTITGFVEDQTYNHLPAVFIPISEWRKIAFAAPGSDKGIEAPVNAIMLQGPDIDPETINAKLTNTDTVTRSEAVQGLPGYKEENGSIMMMLGFLLVISAFVLGVFFYVMTMQKTNQFGIMKAIGAKNGFLIRSIMSQVIVLSLISIVIGILLTYGTAAVMPQGMPFKLESNLVMVYSFVLLIIALLSSLVSVRKITKIDPLKALGRVE